MALTGKQRLELVVIWIKRGGKEYMDKEEFIKQVCKVKGIEYIEPIPTLSGTERSKR